MTLGASTARTIASFVWAVLVIAAVIVARVVRRQSDERLAEELRQQWAVPDLRKVVVSAYWRGRRMGQRMLAVVVTDVDAYASALPPLVRRLSTGMLQRRPHVGVLERGLPVSGDDLLAALQRLRPLPVEEG